MKKKIGIIFLLAGLACNELIVVDELVEQPGSKRRIWYVHPDSGIKTIQAGLDSCRAGDTVLVAPGTYHEHIVWPSVTDICLLSETWPEQTIIDGDSTGRVISIDHPVTATVSGFTVQHGFTWDKGAGIFCDTVCLVYLYWNIFYCNYAEIRGAVYGGERTKLTMEYCWVINNSGYGIFGEFADVYLYDCIISRNHNASLQRAGGGVCCSGGNLISLNCDVVDNQVGGMGSNYAAGIVIDGAAAQLINNEISRNSNLSQYGRGGGVTVLNYSNPSVISVSLDGNRINGNHADYGAGIYCKDGQIVTVKFNTLESNDSYINGAGIYSDSCELAVTGCHIRNNQGDGICVARDSATINNCDISGNSGYGVVNQDTVHIVNAENNWWGDPSGPSGAGPGSGDSVSNYVDYIPWHTQL